LVAWLVAWLVVVVVDDEICVKIDEKSFEMGGKIGQKSRKSVPGGTPKWRQEAKMIKRGGPLNSAALLGAIFEENGLQDGGRNR